MAQRNGFTQTRPISRPRVRIGNFHTTTTALAFVLAGFVSTSARAQFYTDTGSPSNPTWSVVVRNLNNNSADPGPVPGSVINVNNAATEVGLYGNRPISVPSQRIHVCCNTSTTNINDFKRWFQTDGNTQVFRLFVNDQNTATDRAGAARCEAFMDGGWDYSDNVTYEWTGRYTIARRQQSYAIFQLFNLDNEWALQLSMTGDGGLLINNRRNASDVVIKNPDGSTKDFDGKGFDVRVIDDGKNYKCWIDGVLVAENFYDRPTSISRFRWGKYMGEATLTTPSTNSVILVSGAQIRSWSGRLDTATSSIVKANNGNSLDNTTSWTGAKIPGINNLAVWNSTVTATNTPTLNTGLTWAGIRITNPGGNVTINGAVTLKLEDFGIDMSTATRSLTVNCPVEPNVTAPWVIAASRVAAFNNTIRGYQGITLSGGGRLILNGANSYSGPTTINGGILQLGNGGTTGVLDTESSISVADGATFAVNQIDAVNQGSHFSGAGITGAGGLEKSGTGTLTLLAFNTFTGPTKVSEGTLQLGNGGTIGTLSPSSVISLASGATFAVNRSNTPTQGIGFSAAPITGAGNLLKLGSGSLTLLAANSFTGTTTVSEGVLQLGDGGAVGGLSPSSAITIASGATFAVNRSNSIAQGTDFSSAAITGGGGFSKLGAGTLTLTASNTYTGPTMVNVGVLQLGDGGSIGALNAASAISLANGATFALNRSNATTQGLGFSSAPITGAGGLTQAGTGTLILLAANTYTGPTIVNAGVLQLGDGGTAGGLSPSSEISMAIGATFAINRSDNIAQGTHFSTAPITGAGSLTKSGAGVLTFNAANTYAGDTTLNSGILKLGAPEVIPDGAGMGNVVLDGTLDLNGFNEQINGLSGNGIVDNSAANTLSTLTIGGNNQDSSFSGKLQNSGSSAILNLTKTGAGSQTLVGSSTFSGITAINQGALIIQNATALGDTAGMTEVNGNGVGSAGAARLALDGGITVTGEALSIKGEGNFTGALTSISGSNEWAGNVTIAASPTRIGASTGATLRVSGVIDSGADSHGLVIRSADLSGVVILAGANTYLGDTTLFVGKLQLDGGDDRLPVASKLIMGVGDFSSEFDLNGRSQQLSGLAITAGATAANHSIRNTSATLSTLTIHTAAASPSTFAGFLSGNLAVTKSGPETLNLAAVNTYTGATSVMQGTLSLANANSANDLSSVTIAENGATLHLAFTDTDTVNELFIGAMLVPAGIYEAMGNPGSGIEISQITGTGTLTVTTGSPPPVIGFDVWKTTNGTDQLINGDHDADGVPNGIEYFLGGSGNTTGHTSLPSIVSADQTYSITWTKGVGYSGNYGTHFTVETSNTLSGIWSTELADPEPNATVTFPTAGTVKYTFPSPLSVRKFVRLKVIAP